MKTCSFCGEGVLERKTIKETYTYKDHSIEAKQRGEWCYVFQMFGQPSPESLSAF